jgi:hypothetical protein
LLPSDVWFVKKTAEIFGRFSVVSTNGRSQRQCSKQPEEFLDDDSDSSVDEGYLETTPLAAQDATYADSS